MSSKTSPFIQNITLHPKRQLLSKRVVRHPKQHPTLSKTTSNIIKRHPKRHLNSSKTSSVIQNIIRQSKRHSTIKMPSNVIPHPTTYQTSCNVIQTVIQNFIRRSNVIRQSKRHPTSSVTQPHPKRHPISSKTLSNVIQNVIRNVIQNVIQNVTRHPKCRPKCHPSSKTSPFIQNVSCYPK